MENWYLFVLAGLCAGIVSSLFGVGAGIVMVPILALGFGFAQKSAQGTALFVMIPMALVGAIRYRLNPEIEVNLNVAVLMAVGGVFGALIGSKLVFNIPPLILKRMFSVFIIIVGLNMFGKTLKKSVPPIEPRSETILDEENPSHGSLKFIPLNDE